MHPSRRRGGRLTPLVGVAVASLVAATAASPAQATPAPAGAAPNAAPDRLGAAAARHYDVTLITGDTVHVTVSADGTYQTRTDLAPRPDGRKVTMTVLTGGGHTYLLPSDAADLVAAGQVDRALFDVQQLVADGYADTTASGLPVIVQYPGQSARSSTAAPQLQARADALPGSTPVRTLESINGVALSVTKSTAAEFWASLAPTQAQPKARTSTLGAGLSRVWLDGRVHASLDESVPMIGAPQAWAAGYDGTGVNVAVLDTGIDEAHPDLAGKVVAGRSFVPGVDSVQDGHGHGTHVASTVAGTGAASEGKYRGVAPGAALVIGKVLDDNGSGLNSWIIDAMEWATKTEHARIVNMSLGSSQPSDGTDPLSQAVDDLTASTGALFVIAAGNSGKAGARTITAPGAAGSALTVGAVDDSDQLAWFSSMGPRITNYGLKPDIAAPGVDITAARSSTGTDMGGDATVVDQYYDTASGTSMATPHVAGSAAILLQEHPDWTQAQLRAALTSTARDDGFTVYQQGAGRVDIGAASAATVLSQTAKADFGRIRYPQTGPDITRTITYRNDGDQPVTLDLTATVMAASGGAAPDGMFAVSPASLVVSAHGTADATVSLDPTRGSPGLYSGAVLATGDGVSLRVPVGGYKEPEGYELSITTVPPDGPTSGTFGGVIVKRVDTDTHRWEFLPASGAVSVHLDRGVYSVAQTVVWNDHPGDLDNDTFLIDPEVDLSHDTSITLDANAARKLDVSLDRPTEIYGTRMTAWRVPADSGIPYAVGTDQLPYRTRTWVTPTGRPTVGRFLFEHNHILGTPQITAEVPRHGRQPALVLHPHYQHYSDLVPKLNGRTSLPVVDVGTGSAAEFAKVDVRGRIALVNTGDKTLVPTSVGEGTAHQELVNAAEAGAAAVFAYADAGTPVLGHFPVPRRFYLLPTLALPAQDGAALRDRLADGPVTVRINSQPTVPDVYHLAFLDRDAVPASPHRTLHEKDLATVRTTFHGDRPITISEYWRVSRRSTFKTDPAAATITALELTDLPGPMTHTEHFGPLDGNAAWNRRVSFSDEQVLFDSVGHTPASDLGDLFTADVFDRSGLRTEAWNQAPMVPGMWVPPADAARQLLDDSSSCSVCRYTGLLPGADMLTILPMGVDGAGRYDEFTSAANDPFNASHAGSDEVHLYSGDTELPQQSLRGIPGAYPFYVVPTGQAADYRLTEHYLDPHANGGYGNESDTTWTFHSAGVTGKDIPDGYDTAHLCASTCRVEPLVFLRYQFTLRIDNTLPAPGVHAFTVTAYHQPSESTMPTIAGLRMQASADGGTHWYPVLTLPLGNGKYRALLTHPRLTGDTGTISLRTEAWDTAGNHITQTLTDAYGLVSHHWWPRRAE